MSSRELTEAVKLMKKTGKRGEIPDVPSTLKLTLTMGESEHKIIMEAIDAAKKLCNSDNVPLALEMICQDWLAEKGAKPEATHLEDHIRYLETVFPVKLSAKIVERPKKKEKEKEAEREVEKIEGKVKTKSRKRIPDPDELDEGEGEKGADIDELLSQ
jgi:hypothetical protein